MSFATNTNTNTNTNTQKGKWERKNAGSPSDDAAQPLETYEPTDCLMQKAEMIRFENFTQFCIIKKLK